MSGKKEHEGAQRFGGEFGPQRGTNTQGVSLSTFKTLVWVSNIGGLLLVVLSLEFLFVEKKFALGLGFLVAGIIVALFPSNYEIKGMDDAEPEKETKSITAVQNITYNIQDSAISGDLIANIEQEDK